MVAAIASAMPVLPLVASIRVSPGLISPRCSARRIIDSAGRSFTEPAGLLPSSLARMTLPRRSFSAPAGASGAPGRVADEVFEHPVHQIRSGQLTYCATPSSTVANGAS
jgi:hypothetical protein